MEKIEYWNFTLDNKICRVEKHNLVYDMFFFLQKLKNSAL